VANVFSRTWRQFFDTSNTASDQASFYMVHTCNTLMCFSTKREQGLMKLQLSKLPGDWNEGTATFFPGA